MASMTLQTDQPAQATSSSFPGRGAWWSVCTLLAFGLMEAALFEALKIAPTEKTMGIYQRIFYVHVPSFIAGFTAFAINFLASVAYLWRRTLKADALAVAAAEVGVAFTAIGLITGPIWAKPIWGIWWTWDARLTLTLVLWVMYVSYLMLRQLTPANEQQPRLAAVLAVFFFLDVPIDYMAIRWWPTQHPQPVFFGGPKSGVAEPIAVAFLISAIAFLALAALLFWQRYRLECDRQKLAAVRRELALRQA